MSDIKRIRQKKKEYYSLTNILKHNAQYNIIIGGKGNGKSYGVKKECIEQAYKDDNCKMFYIRRYDKHITETNVYGYFGDAPISEITNGEYEGVYVYRKHIYFCNYDEKTGKAIKGKLLGYYSALSQYEAVTSQSFLDVGTFVFEEFCTTGLYLDDECTLLMKFISSISRDDDIKIFLVGNTVSRVNPYYQTWCLTGIAKQKEGQIDDYYFTRKDPIYGERITKIAVERCKNVGTRSNLFFGQASEMVAGAAWQTKEYPHLPTINGREKDYVKLYELLLDDMGFSFILSLCIDEETGGQWVYVKPHTTKRFIRRIVTNDFSTNPFITNSLRDDIPAEQLIRQLIINNKICYSDNLTGSDFEGIIQNRKGRL